MANIFNSNKISFGMQILFIIIFIFANCMIFHTSSIIGEENKKYWDAFFYKKIITTDNEYILKILSYCRDDNYYLDGGKEVDNGVFTMWELSHLLTHVAIGYFYNIYYSMALSIGYEVYEYYAYNCSSVLDIGYNFTGFLIGHKLKNIKCV